MEITTITPEQESRFKEWRDRWIGIGLSTEPADFDKAEKAALRVYALCGLERPKIVLRMASPYGATLGGALVWLALRGMRPGIDQEIIKHVWQQVWWRVRWQVERQVKHQVQYQVWQEVGHQVGRQVDQEVRYQVKYQVKQQVKLQTALGVAKQRLDDTRGGAFEAGWCAYVTFLRDVLGWKNPILENFSIDEDLATSCGWVWWHKDVLAISDRPSEIHVDAEGRLHNESGPSIAYRDGWKLYHIHGVAVPDFIVECPDKITIKRVKSELNVEVRRVMIAKMGLERFIRESGLKPVHSDDFGTLYRKAMPGDEPLVVVKVVNSTPNPDGSRKEYFLRVPPNIVRAREAVAWTFGMNEGEYRPATET